MTWNNNPVRYGSVSIALHWTMAILLVAVYAVIELRGYWPKGSAIREQMKQVHFMLGLTVFLLVWLRLLVRHLGVMPLIDPPLPRWQAGAATAAHWLLYLFMFAMPLAGWLVLSAAGKPIPLFGAELPALMAPDKALAKQLERIHATVGEAGYYLIGLHAAAALFHHYVTRDNTLLRMLPRSRRRPAGR